MLTFTGAEIFLRICYPSSINWYWRLFIHTRDDPTVNTFDSVLGWRPLPGRYIIPAYSAGFSDITMTIWPDGSRATAPRRNSKERSLVAIGCSLTQGWAISDEETMFWKLQERHPQIEVVNLGVVGYSTYQSLLLLEEYLRKAEPAPAVVVYGLISHHTLRNVADHYWLLVLSHLSNRGNVFLPYCQIEKKNGEDGLKCFPPESYPHWAGDHASYLISFLKDTFLRFKSHHRLKQARPVTEQLILKMKNVCEQGGIKFYVVIFEVYNELEAKYYTNFLKKSGIRYVNCVDQERENLPEMKVPGEGHPNAAMNTIWADCIEAGIKAELN